MNDELLLCAAAYFRNKGKSVSTEEEFYMALSMDYHWCSHSVAKNLLNAMVAEKIIENNKNIIKPAFDIGTIRVPVAYKPDMAMLSKCKPATKKEEPVAQTEDMLPKLIETASKNNIAKKDFISQANHLSKVLNIDMIVAGLLVLREHGVDIKEFIEPVYSEIERK